MNRKSQWEQSKNGPHTKQPPPHIYHTHTHRENKTIPNCFRFTFIWTYNSLIYFTLVKLFNSHFFLSFDCFQPFLSSSLTIFFHLLELCFHRQIYLFAGSAVSFPHSWRILVQQMNNCGFVCVCCMGKPFSFYSGCPVCILFSTIIAGVAVAATHISVTKFSPTHCIWICQHHRIFVVCFFVCPFVWVY